MCGKRDLAEARTQQIERRAVQIFQHARRRVFAPSFDGLEGVIVIGEEHYAAEDCLRHRKQLQTSLGYDAECAFGAGK